MQSIFKVRTICLPQRYELLEYSLCLHILLNFLIVNDRYHDKFVSKYFEKYFLKTCLCMCRCGDQRKLVEVDFSPLLCNFWGWNSGNLAWQQVPLLAEPFYWPRKIFLKKQIFFTFLVYHCQNLRVIIIILQKLSNLLCLCSMVCMLRSKDIHRGCSSLLWVLGSELKLQAHWQVLLLTEPPG